MQRYFPDFLITDTYQGPIAFVEVKGGLQGDRAHAAHLRRIVLAHVPKVAAHYFLLLTPTVGYIWKPDLAIDGTATLERPPDAEFLMTGILRHYVPGQEERVGQVKSVLELVLYQWLSDLTDGLGDRDLGEMQALASTGFLEAIRGARIVVEDEVDPIL